MYINNELVTKVEITTSKIIKDNAFVNYSSLESVTIGESVTHIGFNAFKNCQGLESVEIPDSVTYLGEGAFSKCENLKTVIVGNGVAVIPYSAFINSEKLEKVICKNENTKLKTSKGEILISNLESEYRQFVLEKN